MQELLKTEENDADRMLHNIHDLATQLYQNVSSPPRLSALISVDSNDDTVTMLVTVTIMLECRYENY